MSYAQNTISIAPMQENLKSPAQEFVESLIETYNPATVLPVVGADGKYHFIYLTYHKETYKFYLGKHTTDTLNDGYKGSGLHFRQALKKQGSESFLHVRLLFVSTEEEAFKQEACLVTEEVIKKYREQLDVCYNLKAGGLGGSIYLSEESRFKQSQANKEAWAIPEYKAKKIESLKEALTRSDVKARRKEAQTRPEYKAKMSQAAKEAWANPEYKAKMTHALKEAFARPEVKAKMSQSQKQAWARPEHKAKMSQAAKEAQARPEVKAKIRQSLKETFARPEIKAKWIQANKEARAIKELISVTGEMKKVHWEEMLPLLKEGWQLTSTEISIYNPSDNNRRILLRFERKDQKVDKKKQHERLIRLLEEEVWVVGIPPKDKAPMPVPGVGGVEEEVEVEEARLEAWGDLMNFLAGL